MICEDFAEELAHGGVREFRSRLIELLDHGDLALGTA